MDRHVPDRAGEVGDAGTSARTQGSLGKDAATAQGELPGVLAGNAAQLPSHPMSVYKDSLLRKRVSVNMLAILKKNPTKTLQVYFCPICWITGGFYFFHSTSSFFIQQTSIDFTANIAHMFHTCRTIAREVTQWGNPGPRQLARFWSAAKLKQGLDFCLL